MTQQDISIWCQLMEHGAHFGVLYREAVGRLKHAPMDSAVWHI